MTGLGGAKAALKQRQFKIELRVMIWVGSRSELPSHTRHIGGSDDNFRTNVRIGTFKHTKITQILHSLDALSHNALA